MHRKFKCVMAAALLISGTATAQQNPFPQERFYPGCIKPTVEQGIMNDQIATAYLDFKSRYFNTLETNINSPKAYFVNSGNGNSDIATTSNIHAMAMNIVVHMAGYDSEAKTIFDGLFAFYENNRTPYAGVNLMKSNVYKDDIGQSASLIPEKDTNYSSSTAADIEIASALLLAYKQWGFREYREKALLIMNDIKRYCTNPSTKTLTPGNSVISVSEAYQYTSASDWKISDLEAFEDVTADRFWGDAADVLYDIYELYKESKSTSYGLVSDYIYYDGFQAVSAQSDFMKDSSVTNPDMYGEKAVQLPLNAAFDFAFSQRREAERILEDTERFIQNKIVTLSYPNVKNGYTLQGEPMNDLPGGLAFIAPLTASLIAGTDNAALTQSWHMMVAITPEYAQEAALKLEAMLLLSGNRLFYNNGIPHNYYDTLELTIDDFADDNLVQSTLGTEYATAHGYQNILDAGGTWYIESHPEYGNVLSVSGTELNTGNAAELIHSDTKTMEATIQGDAQICLNFPNNAEYDLTDMDAAAIRVKGSGSLQITFTAKDSIIADPGDSRSGYTFNMNLNSEWKEKKIDAGLLTPEPYSVEMFNAFSWKDNGALRATGIRLSCADSSEVTFSLDWIKLLGRDISSETFGYTNGSVNLSKKANTTANRLSAVVASSGVVRADLGVIQDETVDISIVSLSGKMLYRQSHQLNHGANAVHMNVNSLAKGIYFMNVKGSSINQVQKFIIQ